MRYLTVGTSEITREKFIPVEDTEKGSLKPRGGLWFTRYEESYDNYNEWVDYLITDPTTLYYKSKGHSIWKQPCSVVTLNNGANIYQLDGRESFDYLREKYPLDDKKFSYEAISHLYDGIFVDMYKLLCSIKDGETRSKIYKFAVNSLVLFNLDCIDHYQSGIVLIDPFDFEYASCEGTTYKIKVEDTKKRILTKK